MSRARRAFHPAIPGDGGEVTLDPEESHHLSRVLRLRAGEPVSVFDGMGGEWDARIVDASSRAARLAVGAKRDNPVEPELHVELVQGACRADRIEWVLQKGTEIGVSAFTIVPFTRSEGIDPPPARIERWRKIVLEACKQSGRRIVPAVTSMETAPSLEERDLGIVLDAGSEAPPIGSVVTATDVPAKVRIAVGPEGGFETEEVDALAAAGWRRAGLGPRVLRTETAGPVAAALVLHAWGDLGSKP